MYMNLFRPSLTTFLGGINFFFNSQQSAIPTNGKSHDPLSFFKDSAIIYFLPIKKSYCDIQLMWKGLQSK